MKIFLNEVGKRFNYDWIFRGVTLTLETPGKYALLGPNGSGKSTLLQILSGGVGHSEGKLRVELFGNEVNERDWHKLLSMSAPYMELIEEYTLEEFLTFHFSFKPALNGLSPLEVAQLIQLEHAFKKPIKHYSSGMRQRVRLGQAIFSETQLVLLDEPCSNLDKTGIDLYHNLIEQYCADRMVVVASNDPTEYYFCKETFAMSDYK